MFGKRWKLFRLSGIPIGVDASWLLILALVTFSAAERFPALMGEYFGAEAGNVSRAGYWLMGLIAALALFTCIVLHELGHAVVGRAGGMRIRGITLFLFGGVAELEGEPESAGTEFRMAIAGPAVSLVLGLAFGALAWWGYQAHWAAPVVMICGYLAFINLMVLAFNLVPAFPLDGGRVLRSILWGASGNLRRATHWAALAGQAFAWILIGLGVLNLFSEHGLTLNGIWLIFIGLFLNRAAQASYQQVLIRQALEGEPVRRFMNPAPIVVPPSLDLRRWVEEYVYRYHRKTFPVVADDGRLEGWVSTQALGQVPRGEWELHTVGEVMDPDLQAVTIGPDADAMEALSRIQQTGLSRLLVVDAGRLVGIVSLKDLLGFLNMRIELEGFEPRPGRRGGEAGLPPRGDERGSPADRRHAGDGRAGTVDQPTDGASARLP